MKKGKKVLVISNPPADGEGSDKKGELSLPFGSNPSSRNASSKYDFVKVKVWLGDNADHYYVLSRFLLSRMLTVTKIPNHVAIKIALELKKLLIDNSLLDVSQSDLEVNLFKLMERRGYGEEYINRYKMMTRFHHQRVPLVILVCGTACVGKSTIATLLAQRLNLPNVLQTAMVYELLRTSTEKLDNWYERESNKYHFHKRNKSKGVTCSCKLQYNAPLASVPVWAQDFSSSKELITEFCRECRVVRKGLAGDLKKAMKDGKPIIIEGIHLDPSIYLMDDENKEPTDLFAKKEDPKPLPMTSEDDIAKEKECCASKARRVSNQSSSILPANQVKEVSDCLASLHLERSASENRGADLRSPETNSSHPVKKEKSSAKPIIIPIVLNMAEFDHKALLEEWISTRTFGGKRLPQDQDKLIRNLKIIQDYICSFASQGLTVVNISATTFPQTLDWLHGYLLQCIERGISSTSTEPTT